MRERNYLESKYRRYSTKRLGKLYVRSFYTRSCKSEDKSNGELESIVDVLKDRAFSDRAMIYRIIRGTLKDFISEKDKKKTEIFREMLEYYHAYVLD